MLAVAVPAINGSAVGGLKRNFGFCTAVAALDAVHLPGSETSETSVVVHLLNTSLFSSENQNILP
jgi:hypothetical protein